MTMPLQIDSVAGRPIATMQVLIADDNRDGADVLSALVRLEIGCQVVTAYDGEQALQLALSAPFDVLILDLQMPGLSGLEVASIARSKAGLAKPPLMLAMTGRRDLADDLAVVDARFDRAFAKPLDHDTVFATLRAHWQGVVTVRAPVEFRCLDTLTQAARKVLPLLTANGQQLSFDGEGPELVLFGDEVALQSDFYRLMCSALDLMGNGIVMVAARSVVDEGGTQAVTVNVAGSAALESPLRRAEILRGLGLAIDAASVTHPDTGGIVQAFGVFPNSGGAVTFASHPREGVLLRFELSVRPVEREPSPTADGARAWIVDARSIEPAVLERRLQRLGWRVSRFASLAEASARVNAAVLSPGPELLLIRDDPLNSRSALADLRSRMPDRTRCLLLVSAGASALSAAGAMDRWDLRVEPLSPADLGEASLLARDAEFAASGPATVSLSLLGRRKVLVVDDNEINRILACAMLQALGYEVAAVADGLDAIEHCKQMPPDVLLMDVHMPVLSGIDASRRIVELQKSGRVAPFAIVVASADDGTETVARCFEAGVSGYLCKPLGLDVMRAELRRVGVPAAA